MSDLNARLNKLNERVDELVSNPSELTKDALLAEVRAFYDEVKTMELKAASKPAKAEVPVAVAKAVPTVEPVKTPEPEPEVTPEPVAVKDVPVAKKMVPVVERVVPPVEKTEEPTAPVAEAPVERIEEHVAAPLAEASKAEEKPKAKKEPMIGKDEPATKDKDMKILAGQFNQSPLQDLRSGIPLNEKFGIIRNLFKGNASDFGDAVLKLNNAASAKEMTHYLVLLKQRFEWDERTEAYQTFVGYVERRMLSLQPSDANSDQ